MPTWLGVNRCTQGHGQHLEGHGQHTNVHHCTPDPIIHLTVSSYTPNTCTPVPPTVWHCVDTAMPAGHTYTPQRCLYSQVHNTQHTTPPSEIHWPHTPHSWHTSNLHCHRYTTIPIEMYYHETCVHFPSLYTPHRCTCPHPSHSDTRRGHTSPVSNSDKNWLFSSHSLK